MQFLEGSNRSIRIPDVDAFILSISYRDVVNVRAQLTSRGWATPDTLIATRFVTLMIRGDGKGKCLRGFAKYF